MSITQPSQPKSAFVEQDDLRVTVAPSTKVSVLQKIVNTKAGHIAKLKLRFPEVSLQPKISDRSLYDALRAPNASYIFECKKASPSKGLIRENFDLTSIANTYSQYASGISVLTDEQFFQGSFDYLPIVRANVSQPILCKDFFIHPYQVKLAAHQGADAILLMLSVLDDRQYRLLAAEAARYKLDILTEVSNQEELDRAIALNAAIIGINNRNLRDLSTDLATTEVLAPQIPADRVIISESGIYNQQQVRRLNPLVHGYLVGSSLMAQNDLDLACRQLIYGSNKVCGLTQAEDMQAVAKAGGVFGGLIFYPPSKRSVTLEQAKVLVQAHRAQEQQLNLVGVFVNEQPQTIAKTAQELGLYAVQLHGKENSLQVSAIKHALIQANCGDCQVWKAVAVEVENPSTQPLVDSEIVKLVDRILYDSKSAGQFGGTGIQFDWQQELPEKQHAMLAGGLDPQNAYQAKQQGFFGLDFNSGLESAPGVKQHDQIQRTFAELRKN